MKEIWNWTQAAIAAAGGGLEKQITQFLIFFIKLPPFKNILP